MKVNEIIEQCNELLEDKTYFLQTIELTKDEVKVLLDEIERLNNIINKTIGYIERCKAFGLLDHKIIISISLLENILKGDNKDGKN